jgi:hypothetical protein
MDSIKQNTLLQALTKGYFTNRTLLDECFGFEGDVKEHWKKLLNNIEQLDGEELRGRQLELLTLLKENGVTYNVLWRYRRAEPSVVARHHAFADFRSRVENHRAGNETACVCPQQDT